MKVVVDTNILVSAVMSRENGCRRIVRLAFDGEIIPLVSNALYCEYEDVFGREDIFAQLPFDKQKRNIFLDDFLSVCRWVDVKYLWRPNLKDESDNHLLELAIGGQAQALVTQNVKDFNHGDLKTDVDILDPFHFLAQRRAGQWQH